MQLEPAAATAPQAAPPHGHQEQAGGGEAPPAKRARTAALLGAPAPSATGELEAAALLPALQQLLSAYQVEYWALLEELRAKHNGLPSADGSSAGAAAEAAAAHGSVRDLVSAAADGQQQAQPQQQQAQQEQAQQERYGDARCGFATPAAHAGGEQQAPGAVPPGLVEVERALLALPRGSDQGAASEEQLQAWRQRFAGAAPAFAALEQLASAASMQYLDAQGGLACLCSEHGRWVVRRSTLSIGRSTDSKGDVDLDLGKPAGRAGAGSRVSRLQAQLALAVDGAWRITNVGRAPLAVNGQQVPRGDSAVLPHLSLLEVGGVSLLFMINRLATQRAVARSNHLVM